MTKCETCNRAANNFDGYCNDCRKMQKTKQAALTLLADEGFMDRLAEWFYLQTPTGYDIYLRKASVEWKDLPETTWADDYPAPTGQCGTTIMKMGKDTFREKAEQAIRKAAGVEKDE